MILRFTVSTSMKAKVSHEPGVLPGWTAQQGAQLVIGGGMGNRARQLFNQQGIDVIVGAPSETPEKVVQDWMDGNLVTDDNTCDH